MLPEHRYRAARPLQRVFGLVIMTQKTMNKKTLRFSILCLLAAVLLLAACGRGSEEPELTEAPAEAPTTAPAEPTATEKATEAPEKQEAAEEDAAEEEIADSAEAPESPLSEPESPLAMPDSPLAIPQSPLPVPDSPPPPATPSDEAGSITGAFVVMPSVDGEPYRPVANAKVSLAGVLEREGDDAQVAGYEPSTAPFAQSDAYGQFAINDVPPGKWAVILDMVMQQHLMLDPETGNGIVIEVVEGEVVDLGTLIYDSLPLIGYK